MTKKLSACSRADFAARADVSSLISLKDGQSSAAVRLWLRTTWPEIGGPRLDLEPDPRFAAATFARRYIPGERAVVYIAGCHGLRLSVAQFLNIGVWKISTTQDESAGLTRRLAALNRDRYGSSYRDGLRVVEDPGFDGWWLSMLPSQVEPSKGSPLRVTARGIEVILPADLGFDTFERLLRQSLSNAELGRWTSSPDGLAHCAALGLSLSRFERYSAYDMACRVRMSRARELFLFKPEKQSQRLVRIIETIILNHVLRSRMLRQ